MKKLFPLLFGLALLSKTTAFGAVLIFWDTNGTTPGAGGATPTGTWGVDAYWNEDATGGGAVNGGPHAWGNGDFAVFAAGNDATGAYTVHVSGIIDVADIHVDLGQVTFDPAPVIGGSLKLGSLLSVGTKDANAVARYNVPITDSSNVIRYKRGTVIFGAINTFTGPLTIQGGVIQCAVANTLSAANPLVLANNDTLRQDFSVDWQYTPAVFNSGGLNQQLGTLTLAGADATVVRALSLGGGAGTLSFADSSAVDWTGYTLTIQDYALGSSKVRFGTTSAGLTPTQLSQIQFEGFKNLPGVINASGYVTPNLPKITAITHTSGAVQLNWTAVNGRAYRVWSQDALNPLVWNNLGDVTATGDTASFTDTTPSSTARFYKLEVL